MQTFIVAFLHLPLLSVSRNCMKSSSLSRSLFRFFFFFGLASSLSVLFRFAGLGAGSTSLTSGPRKESSMLLVFASMLKMNVKNSVQFTIIRKVPGEPDLCYRLNSYEFFNGLPAEPINKWSA